MAVMRDCDDVDVFFNEIVDSSRATSTQSYCATMQQDVVVDDTRRPHLTASQQRQLVRINLKKWLQLVRINLKKWLQSRISVFMM